MKKTKEELMELAIKYYKKKYISYNQSDLVDMAVFAKQVLDEYAAQSEAGKIVIKAKALRKKGTVEWYWWSVSDDEWGEWKLPYPLPNGMDECDVYKFPKDAELIDIEISYKEQEGGHNETT